MPELPLVGDEFAGYRLRAVLGRGGTGVVYEAESPRLEDVIAVKVLAPELADDESFRMRFLAESRIAASIDHPHIIPIHDVGSSDGLVYIAMRRVLGTDLRQMIANRGRLHTGTAVFLLSQAAGALDAAHRTGLVHRDVSPGNLLIERASDDDPGHLYLAGFGIYRRGMTRAGLIPERQFPGSTDYVAPEQARGLPVYGSADQYSLGRLLYECLTGRVPSEKDQAEATSLAHVEEVFARVLAKQPGDRYNTCREFMQAVGVALGDTAAPTLADYQAEVMPAPAGYPEELTHEAPGQTADAPAGENTLAAAQPTRPPRDSTLTGPRRGRLRGRWLVIAAALLLVCAGAGAGAYAALSRAPASRPKAVGTSSAMATESPMARRARTSGLMQVLMAADTSKVAMGKLPPASCEQQGTTMVSCTAPWRGVASATFTTYPTLAALYSAYEAEVKSLNSGRYRQNVKDCGLATPSPYGEITWNHQERHSRAYTVKQMIAGKVRVQTAMGRVACIATAGHSEDIVWTTDYGKMLAVAIGTGPHTRVWYWWADVHHNIVFPGTPMDMGGKAPLMSGAPMPEISASDSPSMPAVNPGKRTESRVGPAGDGGG